MSNIIDNESPCVHDTGIGEHVPTTIPTYMKDAHDNCDESPNDRSLEAVEKESNALYIKEANDGVSMVNKSEESRPEQDDESAIEDSTSQEASKGWFKDSYAIFMEEIVQLKWRVLILCCGLCLGDYYISDFPSSLGIGKVGTIQSRFFDEGITYSQKMNQSLYAVTFYPNIVVSLLGGILVDSILGLRLSTLVFSSVILVSTVVFYLGVQFHSYELLLLGRILDCMPQGIALHVYLGRWFKGGRGMAFAMGISVSCMRLGSSANFFFTPGIIEKHGVPFATLMGTFVSVFSLGCAVGLVLVDRYAEKNKILPKEELGDFQIDEITGERTRVPFKDRIKTIFLQIRTLPPQIWLLCGVCVFLYGANFPFMGFAKNFFETKYALSPGDAGRVLSVYQVAAGVACVLAGFICDRTGRNSYILAITSVSFAAIHAIMIFTYIPPVAAMVIFGIFYSFLVAGLWPSVPYLVSQRVMGVSFGVMGSLQSIGTATIPLIVGSILDAHLEDENKGGKPNNNNLNNTVPQPPEGTDSASGPRQATLIGYYYAEALLICFAIVALIFAIVLMLVDFKLSGGIISMGAKKRCHIMRLRKDHPDQDMDCNEFHRANILPPADGQ